MFTSTKSRLAVVASGIWIIGATLIPDAYSPSRWWGSYFFALVCGWALIWLGIYGAYWVIDAPKGPITVPTFPRWLAYTLFGVLCLVLMALAKSLRYLF
jgi:hypothetical protein